MYDMFSAIESLPGSQYREDGHVNGSIIRRPKGKAMVNHGAKMTQSHIVGLPGYSVFLYIYRSLKRVLLSM